MAQAPPILSTLYFRVAPIFDEIGWPRYCSWDGHMFIDSSGDEIDDDTAQGYFESFFLKIILEKRQVSIYLENNQYIILHDRFYYGYDLLEPLVQIMRRVVSI